MLTLQAFSHISVLCGQLLCFFRDHDDFLASKAATSPIIIFKARCEKAEDYTKRKNVFRWCVWIVWLLAVCPSKNSGYFHLLQSLMWANDSHFYCVDCADFQLNLSYETWEQVFDGNDFNKILNFFLNTFLRIYYSSFPPIWVRNKMNQNSFLLYIILCVAFFDATIYLPVHCNDYRSTEQSAATLKHD